MSQRLLIRSPNHLGDCIMALPMINEVREVYPGSIVSLLAPEQFASLFENLPAIDKLISIPSEHLHGLKGVIKTQKLIEDGDYDVAYVLPPSFGSAAAIKLAGVKERIGFVSDGRRLLLTKPIAMSVLESARHRSQTYVDLLRRGADMPVEYSRPKLYISDDEDLRGKELLSRFNLFPEQKYVVISFQAVAESRRWGLENYAGLATKLVQQYKLKIVLVGTQGERESGQQLLAECAERNNMINLAGCTSVSELAAVLQRAELFIGNDSGTAHVAAAVSTPMVILSGADNPGETSPVYESKRLIYREELECISCLKNSCPKTGSENMQCMKSIPVDEVLEAAGTFL